MKIVIEIPVEVDGTLESKEQKHLNDIVCRHLRGVLDLGGLNAGEPRICDVARLRYLEPTITVVD